MLAAVLGAAERLRPGLTRDGVAAHEPDGIERLGRLGARDLDRARRDAWTGIIDPMLANLRGQSTAA